MKCNGIEGSEASFVLDSTAFIEATCFEYDTYGIPRTTIVNGPNVAQFKYAGMFYLPEAGLYLANYRVYDPINFRWLNRDPIGETGGVNLYAYVGGNPVNAIDPTGQFLVLPWVAPVIAEAIVDVAAFGTGIYAGKTAADYIYNAKPPENAYDPNGPKAPGRPTEADGFKPPKGGDNWVPNPNPGKGGSSWGWEDSKGDVWCPTGQGGRAHGDPHWDIQSPGGGYRNKRPQQ